MPAAPTTSLSIPHFLRETVSQLRAAWAGLLRDWARPETAASPAADGHPWQQYWGEAYGLELKRWLLKPVFERLEKEGRIGDLIVDVGSGARPVTRLLPARTGRKRILVDVAAENHGGADEQKIRLDVEKVNQPDALSFRKAMVRARRFLGLAPGATANPPGADTMVFSDLLNYVNFREVLRGFAAYLKPEGRIIIVNLPFRGNRSLFSDEGLKDNHQLYRFFEEHRFEIEHKAFPCRPRNETDESEELIVLVARKCA